MIEILPNTKIRNLHTLKEYSVVSFYIILKSDDNMTYHINSKNKDDFEIIKEVSDDTL